MRLPNGRDEFERQMALALELEDERNEKKDRDIYVLGGRRLYLQSPDGTYFRLTVSNNGQLIAIGWEVSDGAVSSDAITLNLGESALDGAVSGDSTTYAGEP